MILVTGSPGHVGSLVLDQVLAAGTKARALVRDSATAALPSAAEVVVGDFDAPDTIATALDGVTSMFLMVNGNYDKIIELAERAGVAHVVLLSSGTIGWLPDNPIARQHSAVEDALRASGLAWTFVRPGAFMSNALQWAQGVQADGVVRAPFGQQPVAVVHPRDIAAVITRALLSPAGHTHRVYPLSGPAALSPAEQTAVLSRVLGRELRFEELPEEVARTYLVQAMGDVLADGFLTVMRQATTDMAVLHPSVRHVTGAEPRSFEQWASDNADAFR